MSTMFSIARRYRSITVAASSVVVYVCDGAERE